MEVTPRPDMFSPLDTSEDGNRWYVLETAITWCKAIIIQVDRVNANNQQQMDLMAQMPNSRSNREGLTEEQFKSEMQKAMVYNTIDQHFCLTAYMQAVDWCKFVKELHSELSSDIDSFCSNESFIRNIRNAREHNAEFVKNGEGKHKSATQSYISEVSTGDQSWTSDVTGTVVTGDGVLIGGRLPVSELSDQAFKLINVLIPFRNSIHTWSKNKEELATYIW